MPHYIPVLTYLATERERNLTTGKRAERTKLDFRCPICRSAIGQARCLICARRRQLTQRRSVSEIALISPFLFVNRSPISGMVSMPAKELSGTA